MPKQLLPKGRKVTWPDKTYYFLTTSTYLHYPYFRNFEQKQLVLGFIKKLNRDYQIPIQAFSIAMNHFHIMFYTEEGKRVTLVKNFLKSNISREYRRIYKLPYKEFWHSTKVLYIKHEKILQAVQGHIAGNLLKHKEVNNFEELLQNSFSSFQYLAKTKGFDIAKQIVLSVIHSEEDSYGRISFNNTLSAEVDRTPAKVE